MRADRALAVALCFAACLAAAPARALHPAIAPGGYARRVLGAAQGMPSNIARAFAQTADGFLWIATSKGLVRFDGVTFTLASDPGVRAPLADPNLRAIVETPPGVLWVASDSGRGLIRVQGDSVRRFGLQEGVPHHYVRALLAGDDGTLWVGTAAGVARFEDGRFMPLGLAAGPGDASIRALALGHDGTLWVGARNGLMRSDGGRLIAAGLDMPVHCLLVDRAGDLWVGTSGYGLARSTRGGWQRFTEGLPGTVVTALLEDRDGILWVGTDGGLVRREGDRWRGFPAQDPLASSTIRTLFEDREGGLWVGLAGSPGVVRLHDPPFTRLTTREGLSSDDVRSVHQAPDDALWIATAKGVDRMNRGQIDHIDQRHGLGSAGADSAMADQQGRVWITSGERLHVVEGGQVRPFAVEGPVRHVLPGPGGRVFIAAGTSVLEHGARGPGLHRHDLASARARSLSLGPTGTVWAGTEWLLMRYENGRFATHTRLPARAREGIRSVLEDATGTLWLAMDNAGLVRVDHTGLVSYRVADGFFSDRLTQVLDDQRGRLWFSSAEGVFRLPRQDLEAFARGSTHRLQPVAYGDREGVIMKHAPRPYPTGWRGRDGRLYFASASGLLVFAPDRLNAAATRPVIEQISVNGRAVARDMRVQVDRDDRVVLRWTAPLFTAPERLRFRQQLWGRDTEWIDAGGERTVTLAGLASGSHRFRLAASDGEGVWTEAATAILIDVARPVYQTTPFVAGCLAAVGLAGIGVHRLRLRRARAAFDATLQERGRIARDMHDTLAQSFVAISVELDGLERALDLSPGAVRARLSQAQAAVASGVEDARRSIRALRATTLEHTDLAAALGMMAESLRGACRIDVEVIGTPQPLPEQKEEDLLRIGQEAMTNAVRHARPSRVLVSLSFAERAHSRWLRPWTVVRGGAGRRSVRLTISDDGAGFDQRARAGGHGLAGLRERASRLRGKLLMKSAANHGTTISIEVPNP